MVSEVEQEGRRGGRSDDISDEHNMDDASQSRNAHRIEFIRNDGECVAPPPPPQATAPPPDAPAAAPPDSLAASAPPHPLGITTSTDRSAQTCQRAAAVRDVMGFSSWKDGQEEAITNVLKGHDTCAWLQTGGGKSLVYMGLTSVLGELSTLVILIVNSKLIVYLLSSRCVIVLFHEYCNTRTIPLVGGTVIVVSPLIALMRDQANRINAGTSAHRLRATFLGSGLHHNKDAYYFGCHRRVPLVAVAVVVVVVVVVDSGGSGSRSGGGSSSIRSRSGSGSGGGGGGGVYVEVCVYVCEPPHNDPLAVLVPALRDVDMKAAIINLPPDKALVLVLAGDMLVVADSHMQHNTGQSVMITARQGDLAVLLRYVLGDVASAIGANSRYGTATLIEYDPAYTAPQPTLGAYTELSKNPSGCRGCGKVYGGDQCPICNHKPPQPIDIDPSQPIEIEPSQLIDIDSATAVGDENTTGVSGAATTDAADAAGTEDSLQLALTCRPCALPPNHAP